MSQHVITKAILSHIKWLNSREYLYLCPTLEDLNVSVGKINDRIEKVECNH